MSTATQPNQFKTANQVPPSTQDSKWKALRWWSMLAIGMSQLMVVLDATIMNVALPSAQIDLGFSDTLRPWVITAYALAFGGLLLLGGRIADLMGRKQIFLIGLVGFAVASALGGAAPTFGVLLAARVLQGVFAALLAPAALSLLTTTFTDPAERGKAFGIYGALAGAGGAVGLLLGGVLTEFMTWRWTLYVNIAFAAVAFIVGVIAIAPTVRERGVKLDVPGAVFATLGFFALVFGFTNAEEHGFSSSSTWGLLAAGVVLLMVFVMIQRKGKSPLLPLHIVVHRDRGASMLAIFVAGAVIFGVNLYLVYYLQIVLGFTPLQTGLAVLPLCLGIMISAMLSTSVLMSKLGAKVLVPAGMLVSAIGSVLLMLAKADSSYALHVAVPMFIVAVGLGAIISSALSVGTLGVDRHHAGAASAAVNASQQLGGSIGLAVLNTLVAGATITAIGSGEGQLESLVSGYQQAYLVCAVLLVVGAIVTALMYRSREHTAVTSGEAAVHM
ncbi:Puromycin resistance protein pur8 [Arthrobacter alpinus]|uniref:MFS transporter n=1 Tax=Arthrobacter alpinus TaxID=656366 RepID=UPI0005C80BFF|nr:MFS transporter [Arthrobacter alpinus]ALV45110.1 Puromycin resistance protein pur8 [Arthrobacter alpinus]